MLVREKSTINGTFFSSPVGLFILGRTAPTILTLVASTRSLRAVKMLVTRQNGKCPGAKFDGLATAVV